MSAPNPHPDVFLYDTTLRDGSQSEGVSFSAADKIRIAEKLDAFGVAYIEGGWPGSNPKDMAFFETLRGRKFKHARLAAFGSTRRAKNTVEQDQNLRTLLEAETPVVTIFGKSWLFHVHEVLHVTPEQNLRMIAESCAWLRDHGREVIFDGEHFFDGYLDDPDYAVATLLEAAKNGASTVVPCDTNGGMTPDVLGRICAEVRAKLPDGVRLGIHCHNDAECAVANSIVAVVQGAAHVQGTINGLGERCGNANLCSIIPALEIKKGLRCLPAGAVEKLTEVSRFVYDLANIRPPKSQPYVGLSAFAHKAGMHVNAVRKTSRSFEHLPPEKVGNRRRILVSELSGGDNIAIKAAEYNLELDSRSPEVREILAKLKQMEAEGYEYEAADASFTLLVEKKLKHFIPSFTLEGFRVIVEKRGPEERCISEATIKITVDNRTEIAAAEGDGPVNALDRALRKALTPFFPEVRNVRLRDFKVRIIDSESGTAAKTRVLIESGDGKDIWGTVGVSENIIEASWQALLDSVEYVLLRKSKRRRSS